MACLPKALALSKASPNMAFEIKAVLSRKQNECVHMCPFTERLCRFEMPRSRFFWTRNSSGAVLPVGETRPTADFYVSADLTRTSERRLQAGKLLGF